MEVRREIEDQFRVNIDIPDDSCNSAGIPGEPVVWKTSELNFLYKALELLEGFWTRSSFRQVFTPVTIRKTAENKDINTDYVDDLGRVENMPVINLTAKTTFDPNIEWTFRIIWHELYHVMDYNLSGKPGAAFESNSWKMKACQSNPSPIHSVNFALSVGWNSVNCTWAMVGVVKGPQNSLDSSNYSSANTFEDFAQTYAILTQVLLAGGQEICTSSFFPSNECIKSLYSDTSVQSVPNLKMDDYRLLYFKQDALIYHADVATRYKWFWE